MQFGNKKPVLANGKLISHCTNLNTMTLKITHLHKLYFDLIILGLQKQLILVIKLLCRMFLVWQVHGQCGACSFPCLCCSTLCTSEWCIHCICSDEEFQRKVLHNHRSETLVEYHLQLVLMDKYFAKNDKPT